MSLADQQRLLAKVCTDPRLRERFGVNPAQVAEELQLAPADQSWSRGLSGAELAGFALSLRRKRFQELTKLLPASARVLNLEFHHPCWQRFSVQDVPADPDAITLAIRFADFLVRSSELAGAGAALTRDIVRYEQSQLQATRARCLIRWFRHPVGEYRARLLRGETGLVQPQLTIGIWIRISPKSRMWHRVIHGR